MLAPSGRPHDLASQGFAGAGRGRARAIRARRARAQGAYPGNQTIKLVVPYPPGGATDVIGRIVADRLAAMWRTTVIVENIAGAAANIGMDRVAKGAADGTQILVVPPQIAINQFLYARLAFDPEKDLLPVAQVASLPNILVIRKAPRGSTRSRSSSPTPRPIPASSTMPPPATARPAICAPSCSSA